MLKILEYSITHFCDHILRLHIEAAQDISGELYGASIPIIGKSEGECNFYLFFPKEFLKKIAEILINDEKFKEDDWCDLTKECANQIIGYAKNLLNDAKGDDEYKLGIPEYLGKVDFSEIVLDEALTYKFENCYFRIGYCK
ncbi:TPA: chemotaxis protein CheX [Campylobacter jejuni]|nr:chemotaxis protein CheX [Campylobacter jejuni]HEF5906987.1 chemotaxis protein CheX [Campylobacter jejuni]HEF5911320.1 chemotaxis protein CheX [Campylobacter jejuni]HEF5912241.1 chemotaxis protein CheX [Campylobacter jejuni]